jgi:putative ABC transport system permease protein
MLAPPAETELIKPILLEGRWLIASDKNEVVVNTDLLKDEPDIEIGDELDLKIGGRFTKWKVVGVVKGQLAGPLIYANQPYLSQLTKDAGRATFVVVKTDRHDPASQMAIAKQLEERFKSVGVRVSGTETNGEIRSRIELQFNIIVVFLFIMSVLLAIVGGLGLMGTMSINALERTREIGVMRAIGASNTSVVQVFVVEGIIIGTLSWLLGTILSLPLSRGLSHLVGMAFLKVPLDYKFSIAGVFIWLAIIILISTLASLLPAYKAARLSVREILSYE